MMIRGERKARNTWVKNGRPLDPEDKGKRLNERQVARIQVIPDGAFNQYGDRKMTGVTLAELRGLLATGEPIIVREPNGRIMLRVEMGNGDYQWTRAEIAEIVATIERDGVLIAESPMSVDERKEAALRKLMETGDRSEMPEPTKNDLIERALSAGVASKSALARMNKAEIQDAIDAATGDAQPARVG